MGLFASRWLDRSSCPSGVLATTKEEQRRASKGNRSPKIVGCSLFAYLHVETHGAATVEYFLSEVGELLPFHNQMLSPCLISEQLGVGRLGLCSPRLHLPRVRALVLNTRFQGSELGVLLAKHVALPEPEPEQMLSRVILNTRPRCIEKISSARRDFSVWSLAGRESPT